MGDPIAFRILNSNKIRHVPTPWQGIHLLLPQTLRPERPMRIRGPAVSMTSNNDRKDPGYKVGLRADLGRESRGIE